MSQEKAESGAGFELRSTLRRLRREQGITQRDLLKPLCIGSHSTIVDYEAGRRIPPADVLDAYERFFGLPSGSLRKLRSQVLMERAAEPAPGPQVPGPAVVTPGQLPSAIADFVGRAAELRELDRAWKGGPGRSGATILLLTGAPGVGKTSLALHWAHQVAPAFPDGQLHIDLRGFDPTGRPTSPGQAIRGFLEAYGVEPRRIPAELAAQTALYRTLLAGKRVLVLLDNARDAAQVRPLLPGSAGCLTVVTCRNQLPSLIATDGARMLSLGLLPQDDAYELLAQRLGRERVSAEQASASEVVDLCARLPLALSVAAARAATRPAQPLANLATDLRDARTRLDALDTGDVVASVRSVFSWSHRSLTTPAARLFRLLGLHPGPDTSLAAAASLAGIPARDAASIRDELVRAQLLAEPDPGRFAFHDLLRAYAAEQAVLLDSDEQRRSAMHRLLDHYLHTAFAAALLLFPGRYAITLESPQPGVTAENLPGHHEAMQWFRAERRVLVAATAMAAENGFDRHAWQLPWTLASFFEWQGHWHDWVATHRIALLAADRLGDRWAKVVTTYSLGKARGLLGDLDGARTEINQAVGLLRPDDDPAAAASMLMDRGLVSERQGRFLEALQDARSAVALFEPTDHAGGLARALNSAGWYCSLTGDHEQALAYCGRAATILRPLDDRSALAATLDSLGYAHHNLSQYASAVSCYEGALELLCDMSDRLGQAEVCGHLGDTYQALGDAASARKYWERSLAIYRELGHQDAEKVQVKLSQVTVR